MLNMYILVGLGNPGDRYDSTRHNIGSDLLRYFQNREGFSEWQTNKWARAEVSRGLVGDKEVILILPQVFMNNSGQSLVHF
jgi:peptidyl-tRNA hydrolase, PTH1 family